MGRAGSGGHRFTPCRPARPFKRVRRPNLLLRLARTSLPLCASPVSLIESERDGIRRARWERRRALCYGPGAGRRRLACGMEAKAGGDQCGDDYDYDEHEHGDHVSFFAVRSIWAP